MDFDTSASPEPIHSPYYADGQTRDKLWGMVEHIRYALLTTRHPNGHLHSRPMTTQSKGVDSDGCLWFFMPLSGDAVGDLRSDTAVSLSYADPASDTYVSISATAAVVEDLAKKRELWTTEAQAWFPGGAEDPNLALVRAKIAHAGYWDSKQGKIAQLWERAKSAVTGEARQDLSEHAEIHLA